MTSPYADSAPWTRTLQVAWKRIEDDLSALPEPLITESQLVLKAMAERNAVEEAFEYFLHPQAYPTPQVICWLGEAYLPTQPEYVEAVLTAALWLFLFVRIQDDVLDDVGARHETLLLGNVCLQRGLSRLMLLLCGDDGFLSEAECAWVTFSAATLWEKLEHWNALKAYSDDHLGRLGEKFAPIRLPVGAILHRSGKSSLVPMYAQALQELGIAVQMNNDLANRHEDLAARNFTYFLALADGDPDRALTTGTAAEHCLLVAEKCLTRALERLPQDAPTALRNYLSERARTVVKQRRVLVQAKLGLGKM